MARVKKSLGEYLVEDGVMTPDQLEQAREKERVTGKRLRQVILDMQILSEDKLVNFYANKLGLPRIDLAKHVFDPKLLNLVPEVLAKKYTVIPLLKVNNRLTCAMVDPWNIYALDELRMTTKMNIEPAVATEVEIKRAIDEHYGAKGSLEDLVENIRKDDADPLAPATAGGEGDDAVVVKLVNLIFLEALKAGGSDIHFEPTETGLLTRFRVDGILREVPSPPKDLHSAIISRIKLLSAMDIAEKRIPQDGRFNLKVQGREVDVRVSTVPTIYGENVVMRLLDVSNALKPLDQLGFPENLLNTYKKLILHPHGIILVTGPTGSGKTTSLYSSLSRIRGVEKSMITCEDPVEYRLDGVRQIQVNHKVKLTFAAGLRAILRQDPDVIMVGEIRDFETAQIAIESALTGHLVFSTLHTNDSCGSITRLTDMGIEPFLISSAIIGVLAQRLARRICPACKEEYTPEPEIIKEILGGRDDITKFYQGKGCDKCNDTGYKGRVGLYELMVPDQKVRQMVIQKASTEQIKDYMREQGMKMLKDDGLDKVKLGVTTLDEVLRIARETS